MIVRVWGARGSLSAPGPATVGYGGNTSCVELELADGTTLILDAGSGIRELGQRLLERDHGELYICLTHLHLDHVEGLGFFAPLWRAGWKLRFWGPPSATATLRERVSRYLSPPLFPIGLSEAPAEADVRGRAARAVAGRQRGHRGPDGRASRPHARLPDRGGGSCARLPTRPRAVPDRRARRRARVDLGLGARGRAPTCSSTTRSTPRTSTEQRLGWGHSSVDHAAQRSLARPESASSRCSTTIPCARITSSRRSTTR